MVFRDVSNDNVTWLYSGLKFRAPRQVKKKKYIDTKIMSMT